ncbi:DsbA family protein [Vibrio astriarenae]
MSNKPTLYYVYDPMCSWCWGFKPTWNRIEEQLKDKVDIQYVVGGLAADSDEPMPMLMRDQIASYWKKIENLLGTQFNYDFWTANTPRRSTYPSCRAMLIARGEGREKAMLNAVQTAYYLQAKNPSDVSVLADCAESIGLDKTAFLDAIESQETQSALVDELQFARSIGGNSFPSLFLQTESGVRELAVDYQQSQITVDWVNELV